MRNTLLLAILLTFAAVCLAQTAPTIEWQKCLGGSSDDWAYSIAQTTDGGYIVAGESYSNDGDVTGHHGSTIPSSDYWVVKLNPSGVIQWQKSLGGSSWDEAYSIVQTQDGGFIVAGQTDSNDGDVSGNHGLTDDWVVKLNSSGDIVWQKCLGGSNFDYAYSIAQTIDGGSIVAGYSSSNDGDVSGIHGEEDFWVVKLDYLGDIQWQKCLGGSLYDRAYSIAQTSDEGYIVAGHTHSNNGDVSGWHPGYDPGPPPFPRPDYWVVKLDTIGNIEWQKCLGGSGYDYAKSVAQTADGGFIVGGYTDSDDGDVSGNNGFNDYWVVKLDTIGNIEWQKCLGGSSNDYAHSNSIVQATDGGFIVAGGSYSNDGDVSGNHGLADYWVVKLDTLGDILWQKSLGGSSWEDVYSVVLTARGGFVVAGETFSNNGDVSGWHVGYDSFGDPATDYWIVKLEPGTGIAENSLPELIAMSITPNPFNSAVRITIDGFVGEGLRPSRVEIFDLNGRFIDIIPPAPLNKGGVERSETGGLYTWQPGENVGSGVYLVRATVGNKSISERIVYLK